MSSASAHAAERQKLDGMDGGRDHPRKDGNNTMTKSEIRAAIRAHLEERGLQDWYCEEMAIAGDFLQREYDVIPEAIGEVAVDVQSTLQHNVDSYGCDYEWVYSDDLRYGGMKEIIDDQCSIPGWAKDRTLYDMEKGLV